MKDTTYGVRAQITAPADVLTANTDVAIDVLSSSVDVPMMPSGFQAAGTYFVNVQMSPTPSWPLPAPGLTVVLPTKIRCRRDKR